MAKNAINEVINKKDLMTIYHAYCMFLSDDSINVTDVQLFIEVIIKGYLQKGYTNEDISRALFFLIRSLDGVLRGIDENERIESDQ